MKDVQDLEAMFAEAGFGAFARRLSQEDILSEALNLWAKDARKLK